MKRWPCFLPVAAAFLVSSALAANENYQRVASYNSVDVGNDNFGALLSNTATTGNLGGTAGQERKAAVRIKPAETPIIYLARGGATTGDSRVGGAIGIAALLVQNQPPGRNPSVPAAGSNFRDTGLITRSGTNISFAQGIFYDPVLDLVWLQDSAGNGANIVTFPGGTTGPNDDGTLTVGTGIAAANPVAMITRLTASVTQTGTVRSIAVRVDDLDDSNPANDVVSVALACNDHVELWKSTAGVAGAYSLQFESKKSGTWSSVPVTTLINDICFDSNGDPWVTNSGSTTALRLYRFDGATATGSSGVVEPSDAITLVDNSVSGSDPAFVPRQIGTAEAVNGFGIGVYHCAATGNDVFFIATRGSDGNNLRHSVLRVQKKKNAAPYVASDFLLVDGFGTGTAPLTAARTAASAMRDGDCASMGARGTGIVNQPAGAANNLNYVTVPITDSKTLEPAEDAVYALLAGIDSSKGQTVRTSGAHKLAFSSLPSLVVAKSISVPGAFTFTETRQGNVVDCGFLATVNSVTGSGIVTVVNRPDATAPNAPEGTLSGFWNITLDPAIASINADVTFTYDDADIVPGWQENSLRLMRSTDGGTTWNEVASTVDTSSNTVTATGVTQFSLWIIYAAAVPVSVSAFEAE